MFYSDGRFLQRCPVLYISNECAGPVSQCALAAATLNHRDAFSSVMKYFRDFIRLPKEMVALIKILCMHFDCDVMFRVNQNSKWVTT